MQSTGRWRPVTGYEGLYEVSDLGQVRSLERYVHDARWGGLIYVPERILKQQAQSSGHRAVHLSCAGQQKRRLVHRLVLEAFVGPCPDGMEACHWDGDSSNNALSNLRWDTRSANVQDSIRHGTQANASMTRCKRGHEYTPETTYVYARDGYVRRMCRICHRDRERSRRNKEA